MATEVRFEFESLPPVEGMDRIYSDYRKTFGRYPDAFMAQVVAQAKEDLFIWWASHRERIREALVLADPGEAARGRLIDEQIKRDRADGVEGTDAASMLDVLQQADAFLALLRGLFLANAPQLATESDRRRLFEECVRIRTLIAATSGVGGTDGR